MDGTNSLVMVDLQRKLRVVNGKSKNCSVHIHNLFKHESKIAKRTYSGCSVCCVPCSFLSGTAIELQRKLPEYPVAVRVIISSDGE